jgi:hypothetical protein
LISNGLLTSGVYNLGDLSIIQNFCDLRVAAGAKVGLHAHKMQRFSSLIVTPFNRRRRDCGLQAIFSA